MMNLYEEIEICTDSDLDDYDFVRVNDNHVALVVSGTGGKSEDYKVLFRFTGVDEDGMNCYQLEIKKRGFRTDDFSQSLIKKSKFACTVEIDESSKFDTLHLFDISVPNTIELTGEADFVEGRVIAMIAGKAVQPDQQPQQHEQQSKQCTCPEHKTLTDLVADILNDGCSIKQEQPCQWNTTEKYWLDGEEVDKEKFEQKVGKDYWKKFDEQFKELDKQFESMNDTFKNLNDVWKMSSSFKF